MDCCKVPTPPFWADVTYMLYVYNNIDIEYEQFTIKRKTKRNPS